jgi:streptomycin 6-kinase
MTCATTSISLRSYLVSGCRMLVPEKLKRLAQQPTGEQWLAMLPDMVADLAKRWDLQLGEPYAGASVSYVASAVRGKDRVVLKVQWPHEECAHEADALRVWDGNGAVRLLAHDAGRHALLLERCSPGTYLAESRNVDACAVLIDLLPRLWKPVAAPFKRLAEEAQEWASHLHPSWEAAGRPCERKLVDAAAEFLADLASSQGEQVLVHQDLHGENVLAAEREPWLVIDPKPLAGEREFALAPIIHSFEFGHSRRDVVRRLDRLSAELGLDRDRARRWAIAQSVAWSFDSDYADRHYQTARWLLAA